MPRIGVRPLQPAGEVTVEDNNVLVKGPMGELCQPIAPKPNC